MADKTIGQIAAEVAALALAHTDLLEMETAGGTSQKMLAQRIIELATKKGADVASAGTITLGDGAYFHITGTTTITDIDFATPWDGRIARLTFDGVLTLTHHATTLILPSGQNIITAANDSCTIVQESGDNIRMTQYEQATTQYDSRVLAGDQAATSVTTNVNVTGLNFPVMAGKRYWFEFVVLYRAAATTTGLRMSVTVPTFTKFGATADLRVSTSADGTANVFSGMITTSGDQVIGTGTPATGADFIAECRGLLVPSANGDLQLVYASEVSGSTVTIAQGSMGTLLMLG